jgi:hypothetical protein
MSAIGHAASVIFNQPATCILSLPSSTSFVKGNKSFVVVNGSDDLVSSFTASSSSSNNGGVSLYGHGYHILSPDSLSTLFRGSIGAKPSSFSSHKEYGLPALINGSKSTLLHVPDNQTFPTKKVFIFDKSGSSASKSSPEDSLKRLLTITDATTDKGEKEKCVKGLLDNGLEVYSFNNEKDLQKLLD